MMEEKERPDSRHARVPTFICKSQQIKDNQNPNNQNNPQINNNNDDDDIIIITNNK